MRRLQALALILAVLLAGCGKGEYISPTEARLATVLSVCGARGSRVQKEEGRQAELHTLLKADRDQPRVAHFIADARAVVRAYRTLGATRRTSQPAAENIEKVYRAELRAYEDEKALGVRCLTRPRKPIGG